MGGGGDVTEGAGADGPLAGQYNVNVNVTGQHPDGRAIFILF